ncbi:MULTISPECIES: hypothetical protein [unclassified Ruegeria]|uniref:hypothetical protein n=1 Tax=unclassified Ruegeria TaxID=2625375 RepID=UPI00148868E1|nr:MULTISPECIES: hypothetical protein [unclassified Ruegeria]NOD34000.1 hypothetical protein [Ruegeria sp. HKCCD7296]NOE41024.1 hypothetical protein [Ruegeria sp. HKCCD7319]
MTKAFLFAAALCLSGPACAEGVLDKIKKGAENTAEAIGRGAESVGDTVNKGAAVVDETIDSTSDLLSNEATPEETRAKLDVMAGEILDQLLAENPEAQSLYDVSAGYAAFDSRKISVFPVSAGYGRGVAVSKDTGQHTYMNMGTGGVGAAIGIGGFETKFVILFESRSDLDNFILHGYDATAETGAMYGEDKKGETVRFSDGRSFFVLSKKGWRVSAGASGTKFWKSPELN